MSCSGGGCAQRRFRCRDRRWDRCGEVQARISVRKMKSSAIGVLWRGSLSMRRIFDSTEYVVEVGPSFQRVFGQWSQGRAAQYRRQTK